jgi:hypothetical protein
VTLFKRELILNNQSATIAFMKNTKTPQMFSWMHPDLTVKLTKKYGKANLAKSVDGQKKYVKVSGDGNAIFAKTDIKKDTVLFVMGGYILDIETENKLTGIVSDKPIELSENFSIGPMKASDLPKMPQHYVNHSCNPNTGFDGQVFMVSMKKIKKGDEIVYDYGMIMHTNKDSNSYFEFDCVCEEKMCRGKIGENDWRNPDLQKKYNGYFQYYLQKKINKLFTQK